MVDKNEKVSLKDRLIYPLKKGQKVKVKMIGGVETLVVYTPVKLLPQDFKGFYHVGEEPTTIPNNPRVIRISQETREKINKSLIPELPEDILKYPSIEEIDLDNLKVKDFTLLTKMTNLKKIKIRASSMKSIPKNIDKLEKLESIDFYWNDELLNIPDSLYNLKNLYHLNIRGGKFKEISPKIKQLKELRNITFGCTGLTKLPKETKELDKLYGADFSCSYANREPVQDELIKSLEDLNLPETINWISIDDYTFLNLSNFKGISNPKAIAKLINSSNSLVEDKLMNRRENLSSFGIENHPFPEGYRQLLLACRRSTSGWENSGLQIPDENLEPCKKIIEYDKLELNCIEDLNKSTVERETDLNDEQKLCLTKLRDDSKHALLLSENMQENTTLSPIVEKLRKESVDKLTVKVEENLPILL